MLFGFMLTVLSPWLWMADPNGAGKPAMLICAGVGLLFMTISVVLNHGWL